MKLQFIDRAVAGFFSMPDNAPPLIYAPKMHPSGTREDGYFYIQWDLCLKNNDSEVVYRQWFTSEWKRLEIVGNPNNIDSEIEAEKLSVEGIFADNIPEKYRHLVSGYSPDYTEIMYYLVHH